MSRGNKAMKCSKCGKVIPLGTWFHHEMEKDGNSPKFGGEKLCQECAEHDGKVLNCKV